MTKPENKIDPTAMKLAISFMVIYLKVMVSPCGIAVFIPGNLAYMHMIRLNSLFNLIELTKPDRHQSVRILVETGEHPFH